MKVKFNLLIDGFFKFLEQLEEKEMSNMKKDLLSVTEILHPELHILKIKFRIDKKAPVPNIECSCELDTHMYTNFITIHPILFTVFGSGIMKDTLFRGDYLHEEHLNIIRGFMRKYKIKNILED